MTRARGAALAVALALTGVWRGDVAAGVSPQGLSGEAQLRATRIDRLLVATDRIIFDRLYISGPTTQAFLPLRQPATSDEQTLQDALTGRTSQDPVLRAAAVRCLGRLEVPADVDVLLVRLHDEEAQVRREAVHAVIQVLFDPNLEGHEEGTVKAFREFDLAILTESNPNVLSDILVAVGHLQLEGDAFTKAERLLYNQSFSIARPAAVSGLLELIRHNRRESILGLTLDRLRGLAIPRDGPPSRDALEALVLVRDYDVPTFVGAANYHCKGEPLECGAIIRQLALQMIPGIKTDLAGILGTARRDAAFRVRIEALRAYKRLGGNSCEPFLTALNDESPHVVIEALQLLKRGCIEGDNSVIARVRSVSGTSSRSENTWPVYVETIRALVRISPAQANGLFGLPPSSKVWQVRAEFAALGSVGLVERMIADKHPAVRTAVLKTLYRLKSSRLDEALLGALESDDQQLLLVAAVFLSGRSIDGAVPMLYAALDRLTRTKNPTTREARLEILVRIGELDTRSQASIDALKPLIRDFDPLVAKTAAAVLQQLSGDPYSPVLSLPETPFWPDKVQIDFMAHCYEVTMDSGEWFHIQTPGQPSPPSNDMTLLPDAAPITSTMFRKLVEKQFYDGLTFHRVTPMAFIEGGSPQANYFSGAAFLRDEITARRPVAGAVGLSRHGRHTGDMQFFINLQENPAFDHEFTMFGVVAPCSDRTVSASDMMKVVDKLTTGATISRIKQVY